MGIASAAMSRLESGQNTNPTYATLGATQKPSARNCHSRSVCRTARRKRTATLGISPPIRGVASCRVDDGPAPTRKSEGPCLSHGTCRDLPWSSWGLWMTVAPFKTYNRPQFRTPDYDGRDLAESTQRTSRTSYVPLSAPQDESALAHAEPWRVPFQYSTVRGQAKDVHDAVLLGGRHVPAVGARAIAEQAADRSHSWRRLPVATS